MPRSSAVSHTASTASSVQAPEQPLLRPGEQVVAPLDGAPQRLLPLRQIAGPAGEQIEPMFDARAKFTRRQDLHAGGCQLDRERQPVEPAADVHDRLGVPRGQREVRASGRRALHEQRDRRRLHQHRRRGGTRDRQRQRRDVEFVFAVDVQDHPAGDEHGQHRTGVEQLAHQRAGGGHLLEVVDQQQHPPQAAQMFDDGADERTLPGLAETQRGGDRRGDEIRIGQRGEVDERDAALEVRGELAGDVPPAWSYRSARRSASWAESAAAAWRRVLDLRHPPDQRRALRQRPVPRRSCVAPTRRQRMIAASALPAAQPRPPGSQTRPHLLLSIRSSSRSSRSGICWHFGWGWGVRALAQLHERRFGLEDACRWRLAARRRRRLAPRYPRSPRACSGDM
jgi:hypothetical protein